MYASLRSLSPRHHKGVAPQRLRGAMRPMQVYKGLNDHIKTVAAHAKMREEYEQDARKAAANRGAL